MADRTINRNAPVGRFGEALLQITRYFHTIRYLRPVQIYGRLLSRVRRQRIDLSPAPARRAASGVWTPPARRLPSMTGPRQFRFLSVEGDLDDAGGWQSGRELLWLYNLHYFDDLNAENADTRRGWHRALMDRWISENPPAGGVGWDPYPMSLRIVNWIKWVLAGNSPSERTLESLAIQARSLAKRVEVHLLGNHLFANAKALLFAGRFFEGREPDAWYGNAAALLQRELGEQILTDGGHFERSPMYHSIILEDVLDIINLMNVVGGDAALMRQCRSAAERMLGFLQDMLHPDGAIPFFNDAAFDIAPAPQELFAYAMRLGLTLPPAHESQLIAKDESGFWILRGDASHAIVDAGPIGPDYLPGHAHCDTLSYELSIDGRRVIVNSGVCTYQGPERHWFRSTEAHNTVRIDGEEQHEIWGAFRVARRGRVIDVRTRNAQDSIGLSAAHTGYRRLPGNPIHRRNISYEKGRWTIEDHIEGGGTHALESFVHLHPQVVIVERTEHAVACRVGDVGFKIASADEITCEDGVFSPVFGLRQPNQTLVLRKRTQLPATLSYTITHG